MHIFSVENRNIVANTRCSPKNIGFQISQRILAPSVNFAGCFQAERIEFIISTATIWLTISCILVIASQVISIFVSNVCLHVFEVLNASIFLTTESHLAAVFLRLAGLVALGLILGNSWGLLLFCCLFMRYFHEQTCFP